MADHLHPAIDIPGEGLWEGACVAHSEGDGVCVEDQRGCHAVLCVLYDDDGEARLAHPSVARLSLRLDDPLGLGLAGLAGRVAARVDYEWPAPTDALLDLAEYLADEEYAPIWWRHWYGDGRIVDVIREAATLLARLDRLAVVVDPTYTVRSGVVPEWSRLEPVDGDPRHGWCLLVPLPNGDSVGKCFLPLDEPDPIEAAGAALEVCGG